MALGQQAPPQATMMKGPQQAPQGPQTPQGPQGPQTPQATKQYGARAAMGQQQGPQGPQQQQQQQGQQGPMQALRQTAKGGKLSPKVEKELSTYKTLLSKLMHSKATRKNTLDMLKSGPAQIAVPNAALTLNQQAEEIMKERKITLSQEVILAGSVFLVGDLIELGNAGAGWEAPIASEEEAQLIYQDTLQDYIEKGLANKTLDPMILQENTEPLMSEDHKKIGMAVAQKEGIPMKPTQEAIVGNQQGMLQGQQKGGR